MLTVGITLHRVHTDECVDVHVFGRLRPARSVSAVCCDLPLCCQYGRQGSAVILQTFCLFELQRSWTVLFHTAWKTHWTYDNSTPLCPRPSRCPSFSDLCFGLGHDVLLLLALSTCSAGPSADTYVMLCIRVLFVEVYYRKFQFINFSLYINYRNWFYRQQIDYAGCAA